MENVFHKGKYDDKRNRGRNDSAHESTVLTIGAVHHFVIYPRPKARSKDDRSYSITHVSLLYLEWRPI